MKIHNVNFAAFLLLVMGGGKMTTTTTAAAVDSEASDTMMMEEASYINKQQSWNAITTLLPFLNRFDLTRLIASLVLPPNSIYLHWNKKNDNHGDTPDGVAAVAAVLGNNGGGGHQKDVVDSLEPGANGGTSTLRGGARSRSAVSQSPIIFM